MNQSIGAKIKQLRTENNISIEEFAERISLSTEQVEAIESSQVAASIATLSKIARTMGIRLGTMLDTEELTGPVITRANNHTGRMRLTNNDSSSREHLDFFPLAEGKADRNMEPFIIDVKCHEGKTPQNSHHEGEEFLYILDGEIELIYGSDKHILKAGDSIYYDSIVPHSIYAISQGGARVLAVVYVPL